MLEKTSARIIRGMGSVVLGKEHEIRLCLACLLAKGHLLIQDLPGVGKTTLAKAMARVLGLEYGRIQFTSDLLPADVIGVSIFDRQTSSFVFKPGPIFSQVVLADEINRAGPKTQSALLESMEERRVTVEGQTRDLPEPFFVIATQNPFSHAGTFPLPESQLDRFLMCIELGYPPPEAERELYIGKDRREMIDALEPVIRVEGLRELQSQVQRIHVSKAILDYVQAIVERSRTPSLFKTGLSPRAGRNLMTAAASWAFIRGSDFIVPEDVQAILPVVAGHRLTLLEDYRDSARADAVKELLSVPIP